MVQSKHVYVHCVFQFSYLDWSNINLRCFQLSAFTPANIKEDIPLNSRALLLAGIQKQLHIWPPWPDIQPLEQLPKQCQGSCSCSRTELDRFESCHNECKYVMYTGQKIWETEFLKKHVSYCPVLTMNSVSSNIQIQSSFALHTSVNLTK